MKKGFLDKISPFSLILVMVILMIIGVAMIPLIKISYMPSAGVQRQSLGIGFSWSGASPRVIEQEVTSKIEGLVSSVNGVKSVSSNSRVGSGSVMIELKKGANVPAVRFEISSLLKQIAPRLPEGVSYPILSESGVAGFKSPTKMLLSYEINADMQEEQMEEYAIKTIKPQLEFIEGVKNVEIGGSTPRYLEITYDPILLDSYGLNASTIVEGINNFIGETRIIGDVEREGVDGERSRITVLLSTSELEKDLGKIPLCKIDGKLLYLNNLATFSYKNKVPGSYFRINGLNTVHLNIYVDNDANLISMSDKVQEEIEVIKTKLIDNYYVRLTHDGAKEIKTELYKLIRRTVLSLFILLVFVWFANRSMRYLTIIFVTLLANVLISVILYYTFNIELHIFSLAGIAVSFGLIIDTSIVMVDHYSYYRNRKVFLAILAALLTTIGSLFIIFFMPENIKNDLSDFSAIIIINLTVALIISLLFVPAIIEKFSFSNKETQKSIRRRKFTVKANRIYTKYITFTQKRKWIYIILFILAFGIPIHLLPARVGPNNFYYRPGTEKVEPTWYEDLYNKTIGGNFYQSKLKKPLETTLGGTMRLFTSTLNKWGGGSDRKDAPVLTISANMPEGSGIEQLNKAVMQMENYLSQFKEISKFVTNVGGESASIRVEFKEEAQYTSFPLYLQGASFSQGLLIGNADWNCYGIDQNGYSNALNLDRKSHRISISGYNYDRLYKYAEELAQRIKANKRVNDVDVETGNIGGYYGDGLKSVNEMYIKYDKEKVALYRINLNQGYRALSELLSSGTIGKYVDENGAGTDISLLSSQRDKFDLWNLFNNHIKVGDNELNYSKIGEISKRKAKSSIPKKNQEYSLDVSFNFMGSYELSDRFMKGTIEELNAILPIGFKCENSSFGWSEGRGLQYWLILLIVVIIFFMCSILFESLRQPLVIISIIPLSFIGVFLTFYFSDITFGSGGFAALVLLSGLVVNAAIYIVNEYNNYMRESRNLSRIKIYVKSFNHKIIPVLLTILSTVLGLVPFLMDGKEEQFWFSFAIGTTGGLLFSIFALFFIMPILMPLKKAKIVETTKKDSNEDY